ncbi:sulfite exporter TauE/SafE family protein [Alteromonas ponticola]|uniref:Probable membrane transporter protein n=1 Tax=Alteromonas ponticola TaxID=2720613 RepID=A0ABX1R4I5_9ALTE|nr:sulfite exporter TauE/SafE family protein [Alteromonas ponticola]NMH61338.1 sulfite exporter TauE/SafE family protein [Alteromonas ponticola]
MISQYSPFTLLGVLGAVFANATGAGGGVVFVPFFNQLGFSPVSIVATSFAIQCCGMTAGALTWWYHYRKEKAPDEEWRTLPVSLVVAVPASLSGIWLAQFGTLAFEQLSFLQGKVEDIHLGFGIFSIALSLALFATTLRKARLIYRNRLEIVDAVSLVVIGCVGGVVTAWLSVGVGELVAVYLILRGFNIAMSIAVAVILTAFTVWAAIPHHIINTMAINWSVFLFAGMGAIIGGMIAKYVVLAFPPVKLKLFFATWVMVMGLAGLPIF